MIEFLTKFQGCGIKIARLIRCASQIIDFQQYLACRCSLSDIIISYRFLYVEHTLPLLVYITLNGEKESSKTR